MLVEDEILSALRRLKVNANELSESETSSAFEAINRIFAEPGQSALWERIPGSVGFHDRNAWRRLGEYVKEPALFLIETSHELCGFRFENGNDIELVLDECFGFEFYVTNSEHSYLLCFNDHDVLVGAGDAAPWVASLASTGTGHRA